MAVKFVHRLPVAGLRTVGPGGLLSCRLRHPQRRSLRHRDHTGLPKRRLPDRPCSREVLGRTTQRVRRRKEALHPHHPGGGVHHRQREDLQHRAGHGGRDRAALSVHHREGEEVQ